MECPVIIKYHAVVATDELLSVFPSGDGDDDVEKVVEHINEPWPILTAVCGEVVPAEQAILLEVRNAFVPLAEYVLGYSTAHNTICFQCGMEIFQHFNG